MKLLYSLLLFSLILLNGTVALAAHGHYSSGVEGIKAGTLPPEGFYWKQYYVFYNADKMTDNRGKSVGDFKLNAFIWANRFIYSSPVQILGGNLIFDMIVPLQYTDVRMRNVFDDNKFSAGDILVEPFVLGWHGERWDAAFGVGVYLPSGEYSQHNQASPGKGFWTGMGTLGGTVYFDEAKTWSASVLARYEIHSKQEDTNITPGNDLSFEWGIGKVLNQYLEVGATGYCAWQLTDDTGDQSSPYRARNFGVGPEVVVNIPPWAMSVSLRSTWEFASENVPSGNMLTLSLTKAF